MATQKYISVRVCGNPHSNSGFDLLVLVNSPSFEIKDKVYNGFAENSYFFSVIIEKTKVVYKLIKNNVRSHGASREGMLVIGYSVPRGYKFVGDVGPYQVMMALKDKFLSSCMTCKDAMTDTYEYNDGIIDNNVLDSVIQQYPLEPCDGPYSEMISTGPVGYLALSEDLIDKFLRDPHYPELRSFSEVLVAPHVAASTSCVAINNIEIPRKSSYTVYVDGKPAGMVADPNEVLTYRSKADERYYNNGSISFTIAELLEGKSPDANRVKLDVSREEIHVSVQGLQLPQSKEIQLIMDPTDYQDEFRGDSSRLSLKYGQTRLSLKNDLTFQLAGEQLEYCNNAKNFVLSDQDNDYKFSIKDDKIEDMLHVEVTKLPKSVPPPMANGGKKSSFDPSPSVRLQELSIRLHDLAVLDGGNELHVIVKNHDVGLPSFSENVAFKQVKKGRDVYYEGTTKFYLDEKYRNSPFLVKLSSGAGTFVTRNDVYFNRGGKKELTSSDFEHERKSFLGQRFSVKKILPWICGALLLAIALGGLLGYATRSCSRHNNNEEEQKTTEQTEEQQPSIFSEDNINHHDNMLTEEQAKQNLESWNATLGKEDVTFEEIEDIDNQYNSKREEYNKLCGEASFERLRDYQRIMTIIKEGGFDELSKFDPAQWKLRQIHKNHIYQIAKGPIVTVKNQTKCEKFTQDQLKKAEKHFKDNYKTYHTFKEAVYHVEASATSPKQSQGKKNASQGNAPTNIVGNGRES